MRTQPGIVQVKPFTKDESAKLLEPWLGSGLSIDQLPVPRVIVARVQPGTTLDLAACAARVTQVAPSASVDDHRAWIERMRSMTGATVFAGIGILALVIVGDDHFGFVRDPRRDGGEPPDRRGAALRRRRRPLYRQPFPAAFPAGSGWRAGVIGGGAAMLGFGFSESIAGWFSGTPVGDQFAALLGTFSLRPSGYLALAAQAVLIAAITAWASRRTLFATLDDID